MIGAANDLQADRFGTRICSVIYEDDTGIINHCSSGRWFSKTYKKKNRDCREM